MHKILFIFLFCFTNCRQHPSWDHKTVHCMRFTASIMTKILISQISESHNQIVGYLASFKPKTQDNQQQVGKACTFEVPNDSAAPVWMLFLFISVLSWARCGLSLSRVLNWGCRDLREALQTWLELQQGIQTMGKLSVEEAGLKMVGTFFVLEWGWRLLHFRIPWIPLTELSIHEMGFHWCRGTTWELHQSHGGATELSCFETIPGLNEKEIFHL